MEIPPLIATTNTATPQATPIQEVNIVLLQQILNLKVRLTLHEVQSYMGAIMTDNHEL